MSLQRLNTLWLAKDRKSYLRYLCVFIFIFLADLFIYRGRENKGENDVDWETGKKLQFDKTFKRFEKRRSHLQKTCDEYADNFKPDKSALYHNEITNNTSIKFHVRNKTFEICNVHHGGMTSWRAFINIHSFQKTNNLLNVESYEKKLVQVRHPFIRLFSAWADLFQNKGWELQFHFEQLLNIDDDYFNNISWENFVNEVVIDNKFDITKSVLDKEKLAADLTKNKFKDQKVANINDTLNDILKIESQMRLHWAPYWSTCNVCGKNVHTDYVLKLETLSNDLGAVLETEFGMKVEKGKAMFPKVIETAGGARKKSTGKHAKKYFEKLTKNQVYKLYEIYKLDFILFDYKVKYFFDIAK